MTLKLVLIAFMPFVVLSSKEVDFFVSIQRDVNEVISTQMLSDPKKVCYPDIGCFDLDGPMKHTKILPESPEKIETKFFAYTTQSPTTPQEVDAHNAKSLEHINPTKPVVIIAHGFGNNGTTPQLISVKDSLLKFGKIETVVMIDWSKGAAQPWYVEAATNTQVVGRQVAFLIETIRKTHGLDPKNVHLIGFSLGAQVSGFAGKYSQSAYKWKFGRISALDAAAPLFEDYPGSYLTHDDAEFVDAIHTSAGHIIVTGEVGFIEPIGHIDFFPHNGTHQPRCVGHITQLSCNHYSSVFYYEASLSGTKCQFTAYKCPNWDQFTKHQCDAGGDSRMGFYSITKPGRGVHYITVTKDYPFC
ncbi:pancreatic lipase-related protein 2-like [Oppia nitens]|uniref:pancreatic lipase-related protein 2-like n=1 Tax=Oppia nitens TaxID=1686743 RepID=UPI0023DCCAA9|nr:pancreatic lipase-related protein 2-like [Oppia nitens]